MSGRSNQFITVYIKDADLAERIANSNLNKSKVCSEALRLVLDVGEKSLLALLNIEESNKALNEYRERLLFLEAHYTQEKMFLTERITIIEERLHKLKAEEYLIEKSTALSQLFVAFNKICIEQKFDINEIKEVATPMIEKIMEYFPEFDLEQHVTRIHRLLT